MGFRRCLLRLCDIGAAGFDDDLGRRVIEEQERRVAAEEKLKIYKGLRVCSKTSGGRWSG
jgi:hypothetical protein